MIPQRFISTRIDCWSTVRLTTGIVGVVTKITRTGEGSYYRISSDKLHSVPREAIVEKLEPPTKPAKKRRKS